MERDDEFKKVEEVADENFKAELDEKHDTFVRGVFHQYVQWTLREKARKENISAGEYRDRLLMAQDVTHKFHRAVHSFGAYDWPKHTHFWHHQRVDVVRAGDESRGFTIDRNELREVAANYLSHPEIQNDPTDWYLMDALVFAVLDEFAEAVMSGEALGTINWAWGVSRPSHIKYVVFSLLFGILGFAFRYMLLPGIAIYVGMKGHEVVAITVGGSWGLYVILRVISAPVRRKAKRKAERLLTLMSDAYAQLNNTVISPVRLRDALNKAAEAGVMFDGALFAIVDRAIKRDETAFVFRR